MVVPTVRFILIEICFPIHNASAEKCDPDDLRQL